MDSRLQAQQAQLEAKMLALRQQQETLRAEQSQIQANKEQELRLACKENNIPLIKSLIASGIRGNLESAIKTACNNNNVELVSVLLDANFSANLEHELRIACHKGQTDLVKLLLKHNVNFDSAQGYHVPYDHYDESPEPYEGDAIYNAIKGDQPEILELLINHAAQKLQANLLQYKLKQKDSYSRDQEDVCVPTFDVLAQQIASVIEANAYQYKDVKLSLTRARSQSLLIEAIKTNSIKCAKFLATQYKDAHYSQVAVYDENHNRPGYGHCNDLDQNTFVIGEASERQYQNWVPTWTVYLEHKERSMEQVTLNEESISELAKTIKSLKKTEELRSMSRESLECEIERLNKKKTKKDCNIYEIDADIKACMAIKTEKEKNGESDYSGYSSHEIRRAIKLKDPALIATILSTFKCSKKDNPLFTYQHWSGGDFNHNSTQGSALCLAIDLGRNDIAKFLIESGCDIEEKYGNQTRWESSVWGHGGSHVWDRERDLSPLLLATMKGQADVVQLLVKHGADLSVKNRAGKTALQLTNDATIKGLLTNVNTFAGRLSRLPNPEPMPIWLCCTSSGKVMEDPICVEGELYDRAAYRLINNDVATQAKTVKVIVQAIEHTVKKQEEAARLDVKQPSFGMFKH